MSCRVGITTNLQERKAHWAREHSNMHNWQKYGPYSSREAAQRKEDQLAKQYGCEAHHGGADPQNSSARWWVYKFDH